MEAKQSNKSIYRSIIRAVAIIVVVIAGYKGVEVVKISRSLDRQIKEITKEVTAQSQKLGNLKLEYEQIDSLSTVETMARDKLGYVKHDEIVFREKY